MDITRRAEFVHGGLSEASVFRLKSGQQAF